MVAVFLLPSAFDLDLRIDPFREVFRRWVFANGELDGPANLDSDCKRDKTADTGLPNCWAKNLQEKSYLQGDA